MNFVERSSEKETCSCKYLQARFYKDSAGNSTFAKTVYFALLKPTKEMSQPVGAGQGTAKTFS